jgi:hypothetical protein
LKVNHQLESRMPEIGLFGSEGGAPTHGVPTLSTAGRLTYGSRLAATATTLIPDPSEICAEKEPASS